MSGYDDYKLRKWRQGLQAHKDVITTEGQASRPKPKPPAEQAIESEVNARLQKLQTKGDN